MRQMATRGTTAAIVIALLLFSGSGRDLHANMVEPEGPPGCDPASWAGETAQGARERYEKNIAQRRTVTEHLAAHLATQARCNLPPDAAGRLHPRSSPCRGAENSLRDHNKPTERTVNDCGRILNMMSENPELWNQQVSGLMENSGTRLVAKMNGRCRPCTGAMLASIMRDRCDPMDTCEVIHALVNEGRGGNLHQKWDLMFPGLRPLYPSWRDLEFLKTIEDRGLLP